MRTTIALLTCLLVLALAPAARADFVSVTWPCAPIGAISGFAASSNAWLAFCVNEENGGNVRQRAVRLTRDAGRTWSEIPWGSWQASGIAVGPDGGFYLGVTMSAAAAGQHGRIVRVDPATGAVAVLAPVVPAPNAAAVLSPPAWDGAGRLWVAYTDGAWARSQVTLVRLAASGAVEFSAVAPWLVPDRANMEISFRASRTYLRAGTSTFKLAGASLTRAVEGVPFFEAGELAIADYGISVDGGASYADLRGVGAVEGNPGLLRSGGRILTRHSPVFFAPTGLEYPDGVLRVVQTAAGLVAVTDRWRAAEVRLGGGEARLLGLHSGPLPSPPFSNGPLNDVATRMLRRANEFRAQAGLTPLIGDPVISQAAENHSRYWTLNNHSIAPSPHDEVPDTPGFTGASPTDRCRAAGAQTSCSEIYGAGVDWWVASIYHRFLIMEPAAFVVGAGRAPGGDPVMNGGFADAGVLVGPLGFPTGRYDGPLSFGGETPDPTEDCASDGQRVDWPLGTAVTLFVPGRSSVSDMTVTPRGGRPLRGCTLGDTFLPDDPLESGTTYTASALWIPTPDSTPRPVSWQFTTAGTGSGGDRRRPCRPTLARARAKVRRPTSIRVRYRACGAGKVTVGVYRGKRKRARALATRTLKVRAARSGTVAVSSKRLRPGRYTLRASVKAAKRKTLTSTITVAKPKRR